MVSDEEETRFFFLLSSSFQKLRSVIFFFKWFQELVEEVVGYEGDARCQNGGSEFSRRGGGGDSTSRGVA